LGSEEFFALIKEASPENNPQKKTPASAKNTAMPTGEPQPMEK
jgi:hypothetical protein